MSWKDPKSDLVRARTERASYRAGLGVVLACFGCNDTTGSGLVQFSAFAKGPELEAPGQAYEFDTGAGYHVRLERARLRIGALYLNRSRPTLGSQASPCVQSGIYVAEVTSAAILDVLASAPVEFAAPGTATKDRALSGEVWLTGGPVDAERDNTHILDVSGTAWRSGLQFGFYGVVTIDQNHSTAAPDPALPGANPICKQRIVTPIPVDITPSNVGALELRVEPKQWFDRVDFASLPGAIGQGEVVEIPDSNDYQASSALYQGLRTLEAYHLEWIE